MTATTRPSARALRRTRPGTDMWGSWARESSPPRAAWVRAIRPRTGWQATGPATRELRKPRRNGLPAYPGPRGPREHGATQVSVMDSARHGAQSVSRRRGSRGGDEEGDGMHRSMLRGAVVAAAALAVPLSGCSSGAGGTAGSAPSGARRARRPPRRPRPPTEPASRSVAARSTWSATAPGHRR